MERKVVSLVEKAEFGKDMKALHFPFYTQWENSTRITLRLTVPDNPDLNRMCVRLQNTNFPFCAVVNAEHRESRFCKSVWESVP